MPPSPPTFGRIPSNLWNDEPPAKEHNATFRLRQLDQRLGYSQGRAHGTWDYTVLRTAYLVHARVGRAVPRRDGPPEAPHVRYWCHHGRFVDFGPLCEEYRVEFGEPNEELFRRFWLEVVEDREGLGNLDGGGGGGGENGDGSGSGSAQSVDDRFTALGDYFRRWAAGVDRGLIPDVNPRFCTCLVMDSESIASLAALPEELPPLRCAVDIEEKRTFLGTSHGR